jgi:hypothetical protein
LGIQDLTAENLHILSELDVIERLRALAPFVTAWTHMQDSPWLSETHLDNQVRVGLVFGSNLWEPVAARALELYRQGIITHFIASGHKSKRLPDPEGVILANYLMRGGVPKKQIFTEIHASNTGENAGNSLAQYAVHLAKEGNPPVILVAKEYHARRAMTALREQMVRMEEAVQPSRVGLASVSLGPEHSAETWVEHQAGREQVLGEFFRWVRYHQGTGVLFPCEEWKEILKLLPTLQQVRL